MKTLAAKKPVGFTDEQRAAISARGVSVSLSAGAGCGKTFVLTERFLSHFEPSPGGQRLQPSELSQLVAITFTERAAREMRDRIRKKCHERLAEAPSEDAAYWAQLLRALDSARISTIHSFCASLLRSRAVEAGIDPQFQVLEQAQADTLLWEMIDERLRQLVAARDETTFDLAARFDLSMLADMLRGMVLGSAGEPLEKWLCMSVDERVALWADYQRETALPTLVGQIGSSSDARQILQLLARHTPNHPEMLKRAELLRQRLPVLDQARDVRRIAAELEAIRESAKVQGGGGAKAWDDAEVYASFRDAATRLRETIDDGRPVVAFDAEGARDAAAVAGAVLSLADGARRDYAERKRELGVLDFNDLLSATKNLLADPRHRKMRERLADQMVLLLVDEFQDTDPLQVELVKALCGGAGAGKLFFVGDVKQSIYRFRGADPGVFRDLGQEVPKAGRLSLTKNFRSQPAILNFVNALFCEELGPKYEALQPTREQVTQQPAVEFLWAPAEDANEKREDHQKREADWIARRIRSLIDGGQRVVWDADTGARGKPAARPTRLGDVAILFRALSEVQCYEEALRDYDLDYYLVGGRAFYAQQEVFDVLNLLRAVASSVDAVSLLGLLRSGFFSLQDETIFWLSQHPEGLPGGLFARRLRDEISAAEGQRVAFAARTLGELRAVKDRLPICGLLQLALERTGYDAALLNEFLGDRKLANLRKLIEQARAFDASGIFTLVDFIARLSVFVARQPEEPLAATHGADTDVVRLMTIHQAKGLEFPVVVVPDCDRPTHNGTPIVHFDRQLGPLVRMPADAGKAAPGGYELWSCVEAREELDELMRLLYVATTRAADFLILAGGVKAVGEARGPWTRLLASRFDVSTGQLLGPPQKPRTTPEVAVITERPSIDAAGAARPKKVTIDAIVDEAIAARDSAGQPSEVIAPLTADMAARRQFSFSRLSPTLHRDRAQAAGPLTGDAEPIDPRGLGTLAHSILAALDFARPVDANELAQRHAQRHRLGEAEQREAAKLVAQFLKSPRAKLLAKASQSHAEVEFLLAWPGHEGEQATLHGYIDRLVQDQQGDWHVLDFKTNRVPAEGVAALAGAYELQMLVYALAAERALGVAPKSVVLHFLRTGDEHVYAWDDDARSRIAALVDQAIAVAVALPIDRV